MLAGTLFNNAGIGDIDSRITDTKEVLRAEIHVLEARLDNRFSSIDRKLDEILRIVADHEFRLAAVARAVTTTPRPQTRPDRTIPGSFRTCGAASPFLPNQLLITAEYFSLCAQTLTPYTPVSEKICAF